MKLSLYYSLLTSDSALGTDLLQNEYLQTLAKVSKDRDTISCVLEPLSSIVKSILNVEVIQVSAGTEDGAPVGAPG